MENSKKWDEDFLNQVVIEEFEKYISVKIFSNDGCELSMQFNSPNEIDNVLSIIQLYLNSGKISGMTNIESLGHTYDGKESKIWTEIFVKDSSKNLKMRLFNSKFRLIPSVVMHKYVHDRYESLRDIEIKDLIVKISSGKFLYDQKYGGVNVVLQADDDGDVLKSEEEFIRSLLYEKFSQIGQQVEIKSHLYKVGDRTIKGYIMQCGNMKIHCPQNKAFLLIFGIVNSYNQDINNQKKK